MSARWHVVKYRQPAYTAYPWTVFRDDSGSLDQNSDQACIDGGEHATWAEAYAAALVGARLDGAA